jgi:hypothetical protein
VYCECGCGGLAPIATATDRKYGAVKGKPRRFIQGHNANSGVQRKTVRWEVDSVTGCWNWLLKIRQDGYGNDWANGKAVLAHRSVYVQFKGLIPKGKHLDHLCRNRRCVNPDHLEAVSRPVNVIRAFLHKLSYEELRETSHFLENLICLYSSTNAARAT